jgi:hypothetical protein
MSNSKLIIRSLIIIALLTATAHYFSGNYGSTKPDLPNKTEPTSTETDSLNDTLVIAHQRTDKKDINTSFVGKEIIGKWKVKWNDEYFNGAALYRIYKNENKVIGKSIRLYDENDQSIADDTKIFSLKSFKGSKGKGIYSIKFEGEKYDVPVDLHLINPKTLKVSYDYYGYRGNETWKKQ